MGKLSWFLTNSRNKRSTTFLKAILPALVSFPVIVSFYGCSKKEKLTDGGLKIGWAIEDITPDGPVSLSGQYYERISQYVQSNLKATACAIESKDEKDIDFFYTQFN